MADGKWTIEQLNRADPETAADALRRCCGAEAWVQTMVERRPFASREHVFAAAESAADSLSREDWLEAFKHHPKIGSIESLRNKFAVAHTKAWSAGEQSGVNAATEETLQALARGNEEYERKFGYIFIVCATGKSADEMLALLQQRIPNSREEELPTAAAEQRKITRIRLEKLLT